MTRRRTRRWDAALVGTLALTGVGLLYADATLLTAAIIPLTYVLYESVSRVPDGASVAVERSFERVAAPPGEPVEVTLTVTNDGDSVLPDVRVVDGVPEEVVVSTGSPRICAPLAPGDSATTTYTVVAKRGDYQFDDPAVRIRSLAGAEQLSVEVPVRGDGTLSGANSVRDAPLRDATLPRAGTLPTDSGGSGLEFYATRQYRRGDPMRRIDWHHVAKTGEFITIEYREEQAIRTVLILDARRVGRVTAKPGYPTGAELSGYAGERIYDALEDAGVVTSLTAVGIERGTLGGLTGPDGLPWIDPEQGNGRSAQPALLFDGLQQIAQDNPTRLSTEPPSLTNRVTAGQGVAARADGGRTQAGRGTDSAGGQSSGVRRRTTTIERILARLPPNAQVVVCTPLLDDWPVELAQSLSVRGYPQVLVSPDVTVDGTTGQRLARLHRQLRLDAAERAGAEIVSWDAQQPIDYALRRSLPHLLSQQ